MDKKIKAAADLLLEVCKEMEAREIEFKQYPQELPSFDELIYALHAIEID